jgi:RNA-directed DNA polymerase
MRSVMARLNPGLRGRDNASDCFIAADDHMVKRLRSLRVKRGACHFREGRPRHRDRNHFESLGLHRLRGIIQLPR